MLAFDGGGGRSGEGAGEEAAAFVAEKGAVLVAEEAGGVAGWDGRGGKGFCWWRMEWLWEGVWVVGDGVGDGF